MSPLLVEDDWTDYLVSQFDLLERPFHHHAADHVGIVEPVYDPMSGTQS
jgi:hypothetical protein